MQESIVWNVVMDLHQLNTGPNSELADNGRYRRNMVLELDSENEYPVKEDGKTFVALQMPCMPMEIVSRLLP